MPAYPKSESVMAVASGSEQQGFALRSLEAAKVALEEAQANHKLWTEVNEELRVISEAMQHSVYARIEDTVTHALQFIFEEDYKCHLVTAQKRGRVEAAIAISKSGVRLDPMSQCGGGIVDVISFALRLVAVTSNAIAKRRPLLVLDEPFKYLSLEYRGRAAQLLEDLASQLDFQLIIVTHDDDFKLGKEIKL